MMEAQQVEPEVVIEAQAEAASEGPSEKQIAQENSGELAWATLSRLHELRQPYNLIYRPGVLYVVLRAAQGTVAAADWSMGFAWAELAGAITLSDAQVFATIGNDDVTTQMACHAAHDEAKVALRL